MSGAIKRARMGDPGSMRAMPGTGYAGDPGLFGSIFSGIKKFGGAVIGATPAGRALKFARDAVLGNKQPKMRSRKMRKMQQRFAPMQPFTMPGGIRLPDRAVMASSAQAMNGAGNLPPSGYHWNKTGYYRGGRPGSAGPVEFVAPGTVAVKNRRRNPLNPRALDRSMGRITSAKKAASKLGRITIRKAC